MYQVVMSFFSHVWIGHSAVFLSCILWGLIGMLVISPVMLVDSIYHGHKTGSVYRFGIASHLRRREYNRDTLLFSIILMSALFGLAIMLFA